MVPFTGACFEVLTARAWPGRFKREWEGEVWWRQPAEPLQRDLAVRRAGKQSVYLPRNGNGDDEREEVCL